VCVDPLFGHDGIYKPAERKTFESTTKISEEQFTLTGMQRQVPDGTTCREGSAKVGGSAEGNVGRSFGGSVEDDVWESTE